MLIYKILRPSEWTDFETSGSFDGSSDDKRDGFIHCSSREQLGATAQRIFGDESDLVILAVRADRFGDALRWEPSSGGQLFPHVYGSLSRDAVEAVYQVGAAGEIETVVPR